MTPEGWTHSDLGSLMDINRGLTWKREQEAEADADGVVPVLRIPNVQETLLTDDIRYLTGVTDEQRRRYAATRDWILMVGSNGNPARVGNCIRIEEDSEYLFASFLLGINSRDHRQVDPRYLFYVLRSSPIQSAISDSVQGSTGLRNISLRMLRSQQMLVPTLPEQKKIAAILGSVDEAIQATQAVIDQTRKVKQGLLAQLLTRGIGHTRFKKTEIGEIPEEWEVHELGDFIPGEAIRNGLYKPSKEYGAGIPIIRIADFDDGDRIAASPPKLVRIAQEEKDAFAVQPGDVLINRVNSLSHLGKSAIVSPLEQPTVFESNMMCVRIPEAAALVSEYLRLLLLSRSAKLQILDSAKQAVAQASINQKDVRGFRFAIPSVAEQERIVANIGCIDTAGEVELDEERYLQRLKHGLMQDLLAGRIRVNLN